MSVHLQGLGKTIGGRGPVVCIQRPRWFFWIGLRHFTLPHQFGWSAWFKFNIYDTPINVYWRHDRTIAVEAKGNDLGS